MAALTQYQIFENPAKGNKLCVMHTDGSVGLLEGGGDGGATTADKVSFSPPEGMSSTNVQQAITENFNNKISNSDKGVSNGVASLDSNGKVPFAQLPQEFKAMLTVATYDDLPTTGLYDGMNVFVTDATGDPTVKQGWAIYKYTLSQTLWVKIAEGESLDIVLSWNNITGKPSVFPPDTHTHSESEITNLASDLESINNDIGTINNTLSNKSNVGHTHAKSDVNGLVNVLDTINETLENKSDVGHTHSYLPLSGGTLTGNLAGTNATFANVSADLTGNASTSTKLKTARNITIKDNDSTNTGSTVSFDGTGDVTLNLPSVIKANITGSVSGSSSSCTGNAATATIANAVTGIMTIKVNNGSTEGTSKYTYNGSSDKTLNITAGDNITFDTSSGTLTINSENTIYTAGDCIDITSFTITNTGVRSISEGSSDGTLSVNTNGVTTNVSVHGLGSAAYTDSDDYANAVHTHDISDVTDLQDALDDKSDIGHTHSYLPLSGGTLTGSLTGTTAEFDNIIGTVEGNADSATKLKTARTINISDSDGTNTGTAISFDGSSNGTIKLPATIKADITGDVSGSSSSCTGNSATATVADQVENSITIKINNGTVEGSTKYTFNGSNAKTLNIIGGSNITLGTSSDTLTINSSDTIYTEGTGIDITDYEISNTGVLSVTESNINGKISVNTNGSTVNVSVHGLGSAAYTESNIYAEAVHTHAISDITDLQDALDDKSDVGHTHVWNDITDPPETYTPSDHTHPISDIDDLQDELNSKSDTTHLHDDRYYTETETDTLLNGKSNTGHGHSISDVTDLQDELDDKSDVGHSHTVSDITDFPELATVATSGSYNDLSNTPVIDSTLSTTSNNAVKNSVITTALNGKATSVHTHTISEVTDLQDELDSKSDSSHLHDDRYYTETETDSLLDTKSDTGHTHTVSDVTDFPELADVATSGDYSDLSNTPVVDSVLSTTSTNAIQNSAVATALNGKADSSHTHEISEVTDLQDALDDKSDTTHLHDDRYYTESETDALLDGKSDTGHTHSISDVTSLQDELDSKSDVSHTHSYLPLSGGTLTGNLEGTNATFDNVTSDVTGNASTSSKWATPRSISISNSDGTNVSTGVDLDGSGNVTLKLPSTIKATITDNPTYGVCSTTGSTVAKIVTLSNFVLYTGARITVKFSYKNTVDYPTLNVNNTGAKNIVAQGENLIAVSTYSWGDNNVIDFVYDGTSWVIPNNAITLGDNVMCITNAVFENETLRFYSPDTIKYNFNTVTAANSITIPINKPMCKIVDPSTTPSTAPTNTITISGTPVEGQMLIISNTSSYDAQGSGIYVPSKEIQKFICIDQGDGTLVWWSEGYGRIMLA